MKAELDLHMKSHTGEIPLAIINQSFSDIVKAPYATLVIQRQHMDCHLASLRFQMKMQVRKRLRKCQKGKGQHQ